MRIAGLALPRAGLLLAWLALAACGGAAGGPAASSASSPAAAGACSTHPLTPSVTEGPYFKSASPERTSLLEPGMQGTRLRLEGRVLSAGCQPVARALLDFWQADVGGSYDNSGYRLRGHQLADAAGGYHLETVIPGLYPGRTRHIHVKVQAPGGQPLTTQLFFPGEAGNAGDSIYQPALLLSVQDAAGGGKTATYDFYVQAS